MASFNNTVITNKGKTVQAKVKAGIATYQFTKIETSDYNYSAVPNLEQLTALQSVKQSSEVSSIEVVGGTSVKVKSSFTNSALAVGYYLRTIGLYAEDPQEGEILYSITTAIIPDWVPPITGISSSSMLIDLVTSVSSSNNVSLVVSSNALATIAEVTALRSDLETDIAENALDISNLTTQITSMGDGTPKGTYATLAALQAAFPTGTTGIYLATANGNWYYWSGSAWTSGGVYENSTELNNVKQDLARHKTKYADVTNQVVIPSKNLFNSTTATAGYYINASGGLSANAAYYASDYIDVVAGQTYTRRNTYLLAWYDANKQFISGVSTKTLTAPANAAYARYSTQAPSTEQFEVGSVQTPYQSYFDIKLKSDKFVDNSVDAKALVDGTAAPQKITGYKASSKNLFNKETAIEGKYINNNGDLSVDITFYAGDYMAVKENTSYVQTTNYFMAFYDEDKIFISGTQGKVGVSPEGAVYARTSAAAAVIETFQFEEGTASTSYEPFGFTFEQFYSKDEEVVEARGGKPTLNERLEELSSNIFYPNMEERIPIFAKHNYLKDKDVVVALIGDSYSTTHEGWSSERADAAFRPPLCQCNNLAASLWDKMAWDGQIYRRFDAVVNEVDSFTEIGSFTSVTDTAQWLDVDGGASFRPALTRICNDITCSAAFKVPANYFRSGFIYRSELNGANCRVTVAEGNGYLLAWNGSTWVEANNYEFSMAEVQATAYSSASVYQKRLKLKSVQAHIAVEKTVTINKISTGTQRFSYWGVEHGLHEYMIMFLVVSRGSHSTAKLWEHIENDLFAFNPDLVINQIPMINHGTTTYNNQNSLNRDIDIMNQYYFDTNFTYSYISKSENWTKFDVLFYLPFFAENALAVDTLGEFKYWYSAVNQKNICVRDYFGRVIEFFFEHPQYILINTFERFIYECKKRGTMYSMIQNSSPQGITFAAGSHPNDLGNSIYAKYLLPCFDFLIS